MRVTQVQSIVELEDRLGAQQFLVEAGVGDRPLLDRRYEVVAILGRGARGLVVRAHDRVLARDVALKLFPPINDEALEREVLREAQALARLEHKNVLKVHDLQRRDLVVGDLTVEVMFLSIEFIEGKTLRKWLEESCPTFDQRLEAMLAACDGLAAAHAAGILHRDFKPDNVMVDESRRVLVVDFGLARAAGLPDATEMSVASGPLSSATVHDGSAVGTPAYMAPEAWQGCMSEATDQFAWAVSCWEALTGTLPFDQHGFAGEAALSGEDGLRLRYRKVLQRALAEREKERFPSVSAVASAMRRARAAPRRRALGVGAVLALGVLGSFGAHEVRENRRVATCQAVQGEWWFNASVFWARNSIHWHGVNGRYRMNVDMGEGCTAQLRIWKEGDVKDVDVRYDSSHVQWADAQSVTEILPDGSVLVRADWWGASKARGGRRYDFRFYLKDGELVGDYRQFVMNDDGIEKVLWNGVLRGASGARPDRVALVPPRLDGLTCKSRCRLMCPSESAGDLCEVERCDTGDGFPPPFDCGPASSDTEDVPRVVANLAAPNIEDLRVDLASSSERVQKMRKRCLQASELVAGSWNVWRGQGSSANALAVEVRQSATCEIEATVTPAEGLGSSVTYQGLVTGTGGWVMWEQDHPDRRWSMMGWNPARGATSGGDALVAYKKEDPP